MFDERLPEWRTLRAALKKTTTPAEFAAMRRSTQDAHYTSELIVRSIWSALEHLGFSAGKILEPAVGLAHFWGLAPSAVRTASKVVAVELDPITAAIAKQLYPTLRIHAGIGFQQFATAPDSFDLAIGNPPFGSQLIFDPRDSDIAGLSIHNYFFARSIQSVRPGGLLAMVVSTYLLDAENPRTRKYLFERATLLGAIRLPHTAFKANAGTEVTTDVIFLQRRHPGQPADSCDWTATSEIADPAGGQPIPINSYYVQHPEMVLGRIQRAPSRFGPQPTVLPTGDLAHQVSDALRLLPKNVYQTSHAPALPSASTTTNYNEQLANSTKVYAFFYDPRSGAIYRRLPDVNGDVQVDLVLRRKLGRTADADRQRMASMIELRNMVLHQLDIEINASASPEDIEDHRRRLLGRYDNFRYFFGYLQEPPNKSLMRDDPHWPLLLAIEVQYDKGLSREVAAALNVRSRPRTAKLGMILTQQVRWPYRAPTSASTARDALLISLAQRATLDLDYMSRLTGLDTHQLTNDLQGEIFLDPEYGWQTHDLYLSGKVKKKLALAERLITEGQTALSLNIDALRRVIPADIAATDIFVRAGAPWLPPDVMAAFANHLFGPDTRANFHYIPAAGKWAHQIRPSDTVANSQKWGTQRCVGTELFEALINNRPIRVYDYDAEGKRTLNEQDTQAAQDVANRIETEFGDWIWREPQRRTRLCRLYNDLYNDHVERIYDGSHLGRRADGTPGPLPGQNPAITFRPHQLNAIWRGIQERGLLLDHVVGAGKTYVLIAIIMELRRLGLARRPMITVPNHLVGQWAEDFQKLYPGAKILVPSKDDFTRERRQRLVALIAAADWDAVIVAHSSFGFIDMPIDEFQRFVDTQVAQIEEAIVTIEAIEGERSRSVKQMEKFKDGLRERIKAKLEARIRDKVVDFSELGIDFLGVDEAHEFKNLMFATSLRNIAGLGTTSGSQKAMDLFIKVRSIKRLNQEKNVAFATGTPISNSIAEMFTMMRYLAHHHLEELQMLHFDSWQSTFATRTTDWEIDSTATGYKLKERLSRFCNLPELMNLYRQFADVVTRADINATRSAAGLKPLTPPINGGGPKNVIVERSQAQAEYMEKIIQRAEALRSSKDKSHDNMLVITNDARKAALDIRLVCPHAADFAGSKINVAIDKMIEIWQQWQKLRGTQLIFCDLSTPKNARACEAAIIRSLQEQAAQGDETAIEKLSEYTLDEMQSLQDDAWDVYNDIRGKLITRGIPPEEIAFIHDARTDLQRSDLFESVRAGRTRFLLGSSRKMGAGMNVQTRLVALHHLDAPWKPMEVEQREGRIVRQGNLFYEGSPGWIAHDPTLHQDLLKAGETPPIEGFEIHIFRYSTRQTYDARMWQCIESKANFIAQLRRGTSERAAEDIAAQAASAAEMKAAASGNPLIIEEVQLRADLRRLENVRRDHLARQHQLQDIIHFNANWKEKGEARLATLQADIVQRLKPGEGEFAGMRVRDIHHVERRSAGVALIAEIIQMQRLTQLERPEIALYRGFPISLELSAQSLAPVLILQAASGRYTAAYFPEDKLDSIGITRRLDTLTDDFERQIEITQQRMETQRLAIESARQSVDLPFDREDEYQKTLTRHRDVLALLKAQQQEKTSTPIATSTFNTNSENGSVVTSQSA